MGARIAVALNRCRVKGWPRGVQWVGARGWVQGFSAGAGCRGGGLGIETGTGCSECVPGGECRGWGQGYAVGG